MFYVLAMERISLHVEKKMLIESYSMYDSNSQPRVFKTY